MFLWSSKENYPKLSLLNLLMWSFVLLVRILHKHGHLYFMISCTHLSFSYSEIS